MEFSEIIRKRYSVRKYTADQVTKSDLNKILEAGRIAPTAANFQPQKLIIVQSEQGMQKIAKAANPFNAKTAIIVCSDKKIAWKRPQDGKLTVDIDATIVTDHMMLQATALGLGTLWMTWFDPIIIKNEFNIPEHVEPVNILLIGYSNDSIKSPNRFNTERRPIDETVFYESL